LPKSYN